MRYYVLNGNTTQVALQAHHHGELVKILKEIYAPSFNDVVLHDGFFRRFGIDDLFENAPMFLLDGVGFAKINYANGDQWFIAKQEKDTFLAIHPVEYSPLSKNGLCDLIFRRIGDHDIEHLNNLVKKFFQSCRFLETSEEQFPSPFATR